VLRHYSAQEVILFLMKMMVSKLDNSRYDSCSDLIIQVIVCTRKSLWWNLMSCWRKIRLQVGMSYP